MSSEKITLHEIKCPNCGATISRFNAFAVTCRCPNCDKIFQILGGAHRRDIDRPERIFPFKITKDEFRKKFSDCFWREFSREYGEKVSAEAEFGDEAPFYVAAYFFDDHMPVTLEISVKYRFPLWGPEQATLPGDCKVSGTLPATDKEALPPGVDSVVGGLRYVPGEAEFFRSRYFGEIEDCCIVDPTLPADFVWEKRCIPKILETKNFEKIFKNLKKKGCSECRLDHLRFSSIARHAFAYVSVWRIGFTFEGKNYYYACDGSGGNEEFSFPEDSGKAKPRKRTFFGFSF